MMIVEAKVEENNTIRIDSENVLQLRLTPPRGLINPSKPVRIIWNDELIKDANVSPSGEMTLCAKGYIPSPLAKRPLGPTPFAYVVGTTSKDPRMKKFIEVLAERRPPQMEGLAARRATVFQGYGDHRRTGSQLFVNLVRWA